jgi:hypothetical protein
MSIASDPSLRLTDLSLFPEMLLLAMNNGGVVKAAFHGGAGS